MFLSTRNDAEESAFLRIINFMTVKISNPPTPIELAAIENCDVNTARPIEI